MKKLIVFIVSFVIIFSFMLFAAELLSGLFLTSRYVPDINEAWNASASFPQEIEMGSSSRSFLLTLLTGLLSAIIAYLTAQKFSRHR